VPAERLAIARQDGTAVGLHAGGELGKLFGLTGFGELGRGKARGFELHAASFFRALGLGSFRFLGSHARVLP